jgi:hypothetical protein
MRTQAKEDVRLSASAECYLDSDTIQDGFCFGCEAIQHIPATPYERSETICPAQGDIGGDGCVRRADWLEMISHLKEVEAICQRR